MLAQNLVEKIAQRFAVDLSDGHVVHSGDYLSIRPEHILTHDNTGAVIPKFKSIGATKIANPRQPVYALDHNVQDTSEANIAKYKKIESFAHEMGVDFYPAGRGIGHQIMCEEGYAWPQTMVVASDSHSNMYGGLGCLGTPIVRTDAAAIWATGRTWWQVPPVAKCELHGRLKQGVTGKDVIITLCGFFNSDEVLNHAIEFSGGGIASLSLDERLTIANMTTEWGALVGLFPVDEVTLDWLAQRTSHLARRGPAGVPSDADGDEENARLNSRRLDQLKRNVLAPDNDATYAKHLSFDLESVVPHVSGPHNVKTMTPINEMRARRVAIQKAYLVSCVNSRVDDLAQAAEAVRGKHVAEGVKFYIAAASSEVQAESEGRGDWQALVEAGAIALSPGCGPCIGLGVGLLEDGETGISATNRNFRGRMGSKHAEAYLASPSVVAASAIAGYIDAPAEFENTGPIADIRTNEKPATGSAAVSIVDGFPVTIDGDMIACFQDNLNTDGIYPGKYTYIDDFTPQQQAEVAMENYDPEFGKLAKEGDILVGGFNFGTGSSREQAATALKYRGIRLVLAGSFSETYKRNAINNGFLAIEAPELVRDLRNKCGTDKLTVATGIKAAIDFASAKLTADGKQYKLAPLGAAAQELIVAGGLEAWVKERL
ncbi:MAG: homoaconitase [candidate division Zixibacteria bacterium]|nr:homoaconitase [candidate division Zixibacteria bacterium]MDH3935847.1 homoaconitase [candidate division Zixibacteria bacterium]MDH4033748.1 homoaconitase [candidate division Zixibacteria bacterium]